MGNEEISKIVKDEVKKSTKNIKRSMCILIALITSIIIIIMYDMPMHNNEQKEQTEIQEVPLTGEYSDLIQAMFPFEGYYYQLKDGQSIQFYSDIECQNEIEPSRFLSFNVEFFTRPSDGVQLYCCMMENGQLCYSLGYKRPCLVREWE